MLLNLFNVIYVLVAIAMIVLILLQRGAGAQAGSGFGAGASATVFGSRGASNFLSRSTAILAGVFFLLSLGMGIYLAHLGAPQQQQKEDLGVMGNAPDVAPPAPTEVPAAPNAPAGDNKSTAPAGEVPAAPVAAPANAPAAEKPAAPAAGKPAPAAAKPAADAAKDPAGKDAAKKDGKKK